MLHSLHKLACARTLLTVVHMFTIFLQVLDDLDKILNSMFPPVLFVMPQEEKKIKRWSKQILPPS